MARRSTGQNCTTVPAFADTNVVVYAFAKDDAKIVAAALLSGCDTLYTEDLEHGRTFDGQLTVVNPFVPA